MLVGGDPVARGAWPVTRGSKAVPFASFACFAVAFVAPRSALVARREEQVSRRDAKIAKGIPDRRSVLLRALCGLARGNSSSERRWAEPTLPLSPSLGRRRTFRGWSLLPWGPLDEATRSWTRGAKSGLRGVVAAFDAVDRQVRIGQVITGRADALGLEEHDLAIGE